MDGEGRIMSASYIIRNTSDAEISMLDFEAVTGTSETKTIRIYNSGDATATDLFLGAATVKWSYSGDLNSQGQELVTEQWLQAKVGAGTWTPIGGDPSTPTNILSLTPPAAGAYVTVELRLVIPAGADTGGNFAFIPFVAWK
jgi:hypothetical protein